MTRKKMSTYEYYEYFEYVVNQWRVATGAHPDTIRALFIKSAIAMAGSPYMAALVAQELLHLVEENFKMPACEATT